MYGSARGGGVRSLTCGDCFCSVFLVSGFISSVAISENKKLLALWSGRERDECDSGKAKDYGEYSKTRI